VGSKAKEAMKAHVIKARITWVSNYRDPITKSLNWVPVIGHPCDHAPIMLHIGAQRDNHDQEFYYGYNYQYVFYRAFSGWQQMF